MLIFTLYAATRYFHFDGLQSGIQLVQSHATEKGIRESEGLPKPPTKGYTFATWVRLCEFLTFIPNYIVGNRADISIDIIMLYSYFNLITIPGLRLKSHLSTRAGTWVLHCICMQIYTHVIFHGRF